MRKLISLGSRSDVAVQLRQHSGDNTEHVFDWLSMPAEGLLSIIDADFAVATMRFNAHRFRVPQRINRYQLFGDYAPDYLPERTTRQQQELYDISGDPWFLHMRELFAQDHRDALAGDRRSP